jgi:hypothetical protein
MPKTSTLPSPVDFFLNTPLYQEFVVDSYNFADVLAIRFHSSALDAFCVGCQNQSVFWNQGNYPSESSGGPNARPIKDLDSILQYERLWFPHGRSVVSKTPEEFGTQEGVFSVSFVCARDEHHDIKFYVQVRKSILSKIGQSPSLADLQTHAIRKYRKVLGEEKYSELSRAVGLYAHGIGVGAFVYLRRIFEHLINEARAQACTTQNWNEVRFDQARMEDKILLLASFLPSFLVESRAIYGILSKGIHALTEAECLDYFKAVLSAIELILDERIAQTEKEDKIKQAKLKISSIKGQLS